MGPLSSFSRENRQWLVEVHVVDSDNCSDGDSSSDGDGDVTTTFGRGQPLSFTLSFGEIPWFDEEGEIRRCDWLERNP